jgi:molecular chaperone GrpE
MVKSGDVKKLQTEIEDLKTRLLRALADYENLQRRTEAEKEQIIKRANLNLIGELLPLFDLVKKAHDNLGDPALGLVKKEFESILEKADLEPIDQKDVGFDPQIHEVVDVVSGGQDGQVAEIVHNGFRLGNWVLRPAKVKVYKSDDKN